MYSPDRTDFQSVEHAAKISHQKTFAIVTNI